MEKVKRDSLSIDRISNLPKDILHRILFLLSQEDLLSKSWRYIWCTRPNLDFSDIEFNGNKQDFPSTVDKTLQQYYDQGLSLEKFRLYLSLLGKDYSYHESVLLLHKWIPLLKAMGVKEFCLSILFDHTSGITDMPSVVFKAESLELLHLNRCNLGQNIPENIPFVRLRVLRLSNVSVENEVFEKIISSCPLLTTMSLDGCKGLKTIKLEKKIHKHLKHFTFINLMNRTAEKCNIEIDIPTLETIEIMGSKIRCSMRNLSILKTLSLGSVEQSPLCIDAQNIQSCMLLT
ncbi:PREDICTED: F-box/LRR-repeat protein 25-like [Erythranthe guttata]|uniref:F-box/LRR-repeat protein 25-like n=1 Tax=Erythranthe guttata TaxID=4155 RepID=UPI00064DF3A3|nr:PREDICTED: F-box/LRR-repeat protein 25-like [Erythranthe guttata]|eukprot:XP_012839453.1 PREDICTED: F-box/LRR-repeat protein 25-like [Erythranthe guttata]